MTFNVCASASFADCFQRLHQNPSSFRMLAQLQTLQIFDLFYKCYIGRFQVPTFKYWRRILPKNRIWWTCLTVHTQFNDHRINNYWTNSHNMRLAQQPTSKPRFVLQVCAVALHQTQTLGPRRNALSGGQVLLRAIPDSQDKNGKFISYKCIWLLARTVERLDLNTKRFEKHWSHNSRSGCRVRKVRIEAELLRYFRSESVGHIVPRSAWFRLSGPDMISSPDMIPVLGRINLYYQLNLAMRRSNNRFQPQHHYLKLLTVPACA